jgi:gamma-glutamylcysteine synthetase
VSGGTYVRTFTRTFLPRPPDRPHRKVGLELEFPIVRGDGHAVDYTVIAGLFTWLAGKGWDLVTDEGTGATVAASRPWPTGHGRFGYAADVISTDVGFCTLEVSLCPDDDLFRLAGHWASIRSVLREYFSGAGCRMLGYGIQPISPPHRGLIAPRGRYVLFEDHSLNRLVDQRFGTDMAVFAITASNQCHVDVYREEAITAVNVANGLSPILTAMTANASVWQAAVDEEWLDVREIFWDRAWSNRIEQIGIPDEFRDFDDYVDRLCRFRPLMVARSGQYLGILGRSTFLEYLDKADRNIGQTVDGATVPLTSDPLDLDLHAGFAWWQARLASAHGTLEVRPCSQQPDNATLAVPAMVLGLVENLTDAEHLYRQYSVAQWRRLRFDVLRHGLRAATHDRPVSALADRLLDIAEAGLRSRGLGEERFLTVLRQRVQRRVTPADEVARVFDPNDITPFLDLVEIS